MTTKEMKLDLLDNIESRLYSDLANAKSTTDEFGNVLRSIYGVADLRIFVKNNNVDVDPEPSVEPEQETQKPEEIVETVTDFPASEETPFEEPTMTLEEIRGKLATLQSEGSVDVAAVLGSFGYARLSEVPKEQYAALLAKANEMKEGK